jgi:hypothetical protein
MEQDDCRGGKTVKPRPVNMELLCQAAWAYLCAQTVRMEQDDCRGSKSVKPRPVNMEILC